MDNDNHPPTCMLGEFKINQKHVYKYMQQWPNHNIHLLLPIHVYFIV